MSDNPEIPPPPPPGGRQAIPPPPQGAPQQSGHPFVHGTQPPQAAQPQYPAQYGAPAQPATSNGMAIAGLIIGIVSICLNTFFIPSILGIVFSSIGLGNASKAEAATGVAVGRGVAIAGLICSIVAVLNSIVWKWAVFFLF